jgi:hypothetical protein
MPDSFPVPQPDGDSATQPVWDRVLTRVRQAELAAERRPTSGNTPRRRSDVPAEAEDSRSPEQRREAQALRRVFLDLGDCYRDYRVRTGAAISADVRDAAYRFRRERDLPALVSVAASLERLETLSW